MKTKKIVLKTAFFLYCFITMNFAIGQDTTTTNKSDYVEPKYHLIIKTDGTEFIGTILSDDGREVLILSKSIGKIYIPKHEIKSITVIETTQIIDDEYAPENIYSTRYFFTTNGLSMKKGSSYSLLTPLGPEIHYAVTDNITIGGISSWVGIPVVFSGKFSFSVGENVHFAAGTLLGSLSWANFSARGALPYGAITFGNQYANITFSGGGLFLKDEFDSFKSGLFSVGGLVRVGPKTTFVFDSFIFNDNQNQPFGNVNYYSVLIPGIRIGDTKKAFQFGLAQFYYEDEFFPVPIPVLGWFRTF